MEVRRKERRRGRTKEGIEGKEGRRLNRKEGNDERRSL